MREELRLVREELALLSKLMRLEVRKGKMFGEWISEAEVTEMTGLHRNTLYNLWKEGKITKSTIKGKANYYKLSDFKQLLEQNQFEK